MKDTFFNLKEDKRERVLHAALICFARTGFEATSVDDIVAEAGISKGGLYEYIESKDDLYEYLVRYSYNALYDFIVSRKEPAGFSPDPVMRTRLIAYIAVEFYSLKPEIIAFMVNSSRVEQGAVRTRTNEIFDSYFHRLYEDASFTELRFDKDRIIPLLKWLLIKTRNDFTEAYYAHQEGDAAREVYLDQWEFFFSVLTEGIYR
ncbi:MAG: TetR/AcrR family transcriptional regulator [Spirochaetales bacterium]|nr:TetR/AcrR family transcriptional regulator [Spirochaetales bacterium]HNQ96992.1 TetR/AcrR family transcriptional regulator [Treponemataceae bacterium]